MDRPRARKWQVPEVYERLLECGCEIGDADLFAGQLTRLINDPRGVVRAIVEDHPAWAEQLGYLHRH